ncbi:MAG: (d)CMP kinase [Pseudomonadota bacterium]
MSITIAIDGPAAAGKGTIGRALAKEFNLLHLDTGLLYRAVGKKYLETDIDISDDEIAEIAASLAPTDIVESALRTTEIAQSASFVAKIPKVREALVAKQRAIATQSNGAVLDGRDIGTVVLPQADVKLFVTASEDVRSQRRFEELVARGEDVRLDQVLAAVRRRDKNDSERDASPLRQAEDTHLIDTSKLSIEEAIERAIGVVKDRLRAVPI